MLPKLLFSADSRNLLSLESPPRRLASRAVYSPIADSSHHASSVYAALFAVLAPA